MSKKRAIISGILFGVVIALLLVGIFLTGESGAEEDIKEVMKDAVLHESAKVSLFGLINVNPGLISAFMVTGILTVFAVIVRIFVIPKFKMVPGKFQMLLEAAVGVFEGIAKSNSPHKNYFLNGYMFVAGVYIFVSTIFELLGVQVITTNGTPITLSAPLSDINGAIMLGCTTYGFLLVSGIINNGFTGLLKTLKDFSLPISMSFRLFGALLSGALVTELVYYYKVTSFVLPVIVGVLFTLLHAIVQSYVLTMLASVTYGESAEPVEKKEKVKKKNKTKFQHFLNLIFTLGGFMFSSYSFVNLLKVYLIIDSKRSLLDLMISSLFFICVNFVFILISLFMELLLKDKDYMMKDDYLEKKSAHSKFSGGLYPSSFSLFLF